MVEEEVTSSTVEFEVDGKGKGEPEGKNEGV